MRRVDGSIPGLAFESVPTPLALTLAEYEREVQPFRKIHRLIDTIEVLVKLHTVAAVSHYVMEARLSPAMKSVLSAGLRTPSLGVWWQFAREISRELRQIDVPAFLLGSEDYLLDGALFEALEGKDNLVALRNAYAHGATPSDEDCSAHIDRYGPLVSLLVAKAAHLEHVRLVAVLPDGKALEARGPECRLTPVPDDTIPGQCYLESDRGALLPLHPLLVYRPDPGLWFFYNDLKERAATILNYDRCRHLRERGLREDLLARYPIHEWSRQGGQAETFRERIEALTEVFKGRRDELSTILRFLGRDSGFLMVWGGPGIGKSALLARAFQVLQWPKEVREQAYPDLPSVSTRVTTLAYFIRRGQRTDDAGFFLDNLNLRLESRVRTGIPMGGTVEERARRLDQRMKAVAGALEDDERLLLVIDGLDEGVGAPGFLESLPKEAPAKVLVLLSSREHPGVRDGVYGALVRGHVPHDELRLGGLAPADVRAILYETVDKYELQTAYVDAVAKASGGNPHYLKLLCEELLEGSLRLNDRMRLPKKMEELYELTLKRIAGVDGTLDLLRLLAAARDYLTPAGIAELLGRHVDEVRTCMLPSCAEVIFENPLTEHIEDYQLFHESLREYLRSRYPNEIEALQSRLADWCLAWADRKREMRMYAIRHVVPHLLEVRAAQALEAERTGDREAAARAESLLDRMCCVVEDERWRETMFRECGNADPLLRAIPALQRLLVQRDEGRGTELTRIARYALIMHEEPRRLYQRQIDALEAAGRSGDQAALASLDSLAAMGSGAQDRLMLLLRAMWSRQDTPVLPPTVVKAAGQWLEEAGSPILRALWDETIQR